MIAIPPGWTDLLRTPRAQVEAAAPGLYDNMAAMAARNGYVLLAMQLDQRSPDAGSQMTWLRLGRPGPVDRRLIEAFVADNNLNLSPADIVEKKLFSVGGRAIAKIRAEYQGAQARVDTLTYMFASDDGAVQQLVFTVRADRYPALRAQLEAIEGTDPEQTAVQDLLLQDVASRQPAR
jgi:hypothetical protein